MAVEPGYPTNLGPDQQGKFREIDVMVRIDVANLINYCV
jgi:hypothetical protein